MSWCWTLGNDVERWKWCYRRLWFNTLSFRFIIYKTVWWLICAISYYRVFGAERRKAPRENTPNGNFFGFSHGDLSPRHTKVRRFSCVAFLPPVCRIFARRGERSPRENRPKSPFSGYLRGNLSPRKAKTRKGATRKFAKCWKITIFAPKKQMVATRKLARWWLFMFWHGDLSPRHTKVRYITCVAFSATVCRIIAKRSERSPCKNLSKSTFGGFSNGDLSRFRPENTLTGTRHGTN